MIEITGFSKNDGPLTKLISLTEAGQVKSDGSTCVMAHGTACRVRLDGVAALAECLGWLRPNDAIALGALRPDLPDQVEIVTRRVLSILNGNLAPNVIARIHGNIVFKPDAPAFALIDFDAKGMPAHVTARIEALGGVWSALVSVVPALATAAAVWRLSTSGALYRTDTGERFAGSGGFHVYVLVRSGQDIERFLKTLHERCWLAGLGWMMTGAGGQLLERSIVDRMVGAPEHLVFEGAPILAPPLAQDQEQRRPIPREGEALDSEIACPPLRIVETARLRDFRGAERHRLSGESAMAREKFVRTQAARLQGTSGLDFSAAMAVIEKQCEGVLLPDVVLPFDDPALAGKTVADVLADPEMFAGATLADPVEGVGYGTCKAKVMRRRDGTPWIHSFAHGRTVYAMKHDVRAIEAALEKVEKDKLAEALAGLGADAEMSDADTERLVRLVVEKTGRNIRTVTGMVKRAARAKQQAHQAEQGEAQAARHRDPRLMIPAPKADAPWLPQMQVLNDVLGASRAIEPPARDAWGYAAGIRTRRPLGFHTLTAEGSNAEAGKESRLPVAEQPLISRLTEARLADLIEQHIDYRDTGGRPVHLAVPFVQHFIQLDDNALPVIAGIATLPMILPNGTVLSGRGLDRKSGVVFRVPKELIALLPRPEDCTPAAVAAAMGFLTDGWLIDVATDYDGKCVLISSALTVLERMILRQRPGFFLTAGKAGSGKTTCALMLSMALTGTIASAAAWSLSDEERRKALLAYLGDGVPYILWDNIPRGAAISCPHIAKVMTAETYTDRVLGVSERLTALASTVHFFTGNNIAAKGDFVSRTLEARLTTDRLDPENRDFTHPDPVGWTEAHRGEILRALYIVLLGNPRLRAAHHTPAETRFKDWWHLVGSAVEHAARRHAEHVAALTIAANPACLPKALSFRELFAAGEKEDEEGSCLALVLDTIQAKWPAGASSADVATFVGSFTTEAADFKSALESASEKGIKVVTPRVMAWRLKAIRENAVKCSGGALKKLQYLPDDHDGTFHVEILRK